MGARLHGRDAQRAVPVVTRVQKFCLSRTRARGWADDEAPVETVRVPVLAALDEVAAEVLVRVREADWPVRLVSCRAAAGTSSRCALA